MQFVEKPLSLKIIQFLSSVMIMHCKWCPLWSAGEHFQRHDEELANPVLNYSTVDLPAQDAPVKLIRGTLKGCPLLDPGTCLVPLDIQKILY